MKTEKLGYILHVAPEGEGHRGVVSYHTSDGAALAAARRRAKALGVPAWWCVNRLTHDFVAEGETK